MKKLALCLALLASPVVAQESFEDAFKRLLEEPNWSAETYETGYCLYRDDFYAKAKEDGIRIDPTDPDMEEYLRQDFDIGLGYIGVMLLNDTPSLDTHLCL